MSHQDYNAMQQAEPNGAPLYSSVMLYCTQLLALSYKNLLILRRSPRSLLTFLLMPMLVMGVMWLIQARINSSNDVNHQGIVEELSYQPCSVVDVFGNVDSSHPCVSVYYSPSTDPEAKAIMNAFAQRSGLEMDKDIVGIEDGLTLALELSDKVGRYDTAIYFGIPEIPKCWPQPCDSNSNTDTNTVEEDEAHAHINRVFRSLNSEAIHSNDDEPKLFKTLSTCPLTNNMNVSYTLFINQTANLNDRLPTWLTTQDRFSQSSTYGQMVPARYWILQHLINMAIIDVITAPLVPNDHSDAGLKATEMPSFINGVDVSQVQSAEERRQQLLASTTKGSGSGSDSDLESDSDSPSSNSMFFSFFSVFQGRAGTLANTYNSNSFSLDDYQNDSVPKWAGGSIVAIGVLVLTLLAMQLLAHEKQNRLIGIMRIMGLKESTYWFAWLGTWILLAVIASLIATGMGKISRLQVFEFCDFSIHFMALTLYIVAMCAISMLFASFIHRQLILNIVGFLIFFAAVMSNAFFGGLLANMVYRPDLAGYLTIIFYIFPWFHYSKIWSDILLNTSVISFTDREKQTTTYVQFKYTWSQITESQRVYANCAYGDEVCCSQDTSIANCFWAPSTSQAMGNLVILTSFYILLAWYFAQVFGASLGVSRPFYFILQPQFWGFRSHEDDKLEEMKQFHQQQQHPSGQPDSNSTRTAFLKQDRLVNEQYLSLRNDELRLYKLSKSYEKTSALKEVTLKTGKNECLTLLGHNGAGKSTLVNCLTGLLTPTFGNAFIFGESIHNVTKIQQSMGVTMQDDILFDELTTRENLFVFGSIRGIPWSHLASTVNRKLEQFHMESYSEKPVRYQSGGMKRRLSLALATLGEPKMVCLDEPTTGMDPVNRNKIWSAIKELKKGRIVILTTHNMEEADELGDTIALVSGGRIRAMGSSLFLKNRYGAGYQLQLQIDPLHYNLFQSVVKQLLPGCEIIHSAGSNIKTADDLLTTDVNSSSTTEPSPAPTSSVHHGNLTIGLKRKSLRALPKFFAWLEHEEKVYHKKQLEEIASSAPASSPLSPNDSIPSPSQSQAQSQPQSQQPLPRLLREWSLSNSTLEEVFLRLCAAEKNINQKINGDDDKDNAADDDEKQSLLSADRDDDRDTRCILCRQRPSLDHVTLYAKNGHPVEFEQLLCEVCSHTTEATKLVSGGGSDTSAINDSSISPSTTEDDAPIQLTAMTSDEPLNSGGVVDGVGVGGVIPATSAPSNTLKGLNTELDLSSEQDAKFQEAWDALGHQPPTIWQQMRALYWKQLDVLKTEKKSSAFKIILLGVLAFLIAWQTSVSSSRCPQGWIQADKNWSSDDTTLPCSPLNVTAMFLLYASRPIFPFVGPPYWQSPVPLNIWDCQWDGYGNRCGFVPNWPINNYQAASIFNMHTVDPITSNPASGQLERSSTDVPFQSWSVTYPWSTINSYSLTQFNLTDRTAESIARKANTPIPPAPLMVETQSMKAQVEAASERDRRQSGATLNNSTRTRMSTPPSPASFRRHLTRIEYVSSDPLPASLNDLIWSNQLWVDAHVSAVPDVCQYYIQNYATTNTALVLYVNSGQSAALFAAQQFYHQLFPSVGVEFTRNRPYPVKDGHRVNETSSMRFTPELEYKMAYWDHITQPQTIFYVYHANSDPSDQSCGALYWPYLVGPIDVPNMVNALTNSFLLTRVQSLTSNRFDIGRNITYTQHPDVSSPRSPPYPNGTCPNPTIRTSFVPFPNIDYSPVLNGTSITLTIALLIFLSFLNFPAIVSMIIYEREEQLIHMMRISGMKDGAYWLAAYAWNFSFHIVWFAFLLIFGYAYGSIIFTQTSIGVWIFVIIVFIHYLICLSWFLSSFFTHRRVVLVVAYLLVILLTFLGVVMDQYLSIESDWNEGYLIVPGLAWVKCIQTIVRYSPRTISNEHHGQLLTSLMIMIFKGFAMGAIGVYVNIGHYRGWGWIIPQAWKSWYRSRRGAYGADLELEQSVGSLNTSLLDSSNLVNGGEDEEDIDVRHEREHVHQIVAQHGTLNGTSSYPALLVHNLRKLFYGKASKNTKKKKTNVADNVKVAVDKLCLTVEFGSCMALLGPNGAGKSTTLSILTGLLSPSSGSAWMCGYNLTTQLNHIFSILGICPQQDIVWSDLTIYSHLLFYARLKGVPSQWERSLVQYIAELIDLDGDPLHKPAGSLSGGMRRRLALGISLIGNPRIWLLDEPTTGLSPETRREIWNIIERRKQRSKGDNGKAIVITTHSMEEADTLCDRIAILADGRLQCIGSAAHLKTKYGDGFKLTLHLQHEFERVGVREMIRKEARGISIHGGASSSSSSSSTSPIPPSHLLARHEPALRDGGDESGDYAVSMNLTPLQQSRAAQHYNMVCFITKMAPNAVLTNIEGKNVQFRLHMKDEMKGGPTPSSPASSSSASDGPSSTSSLNTAEVLSVFNHMERHRSSLLSSYDIEEWGLTQSSLEEVFITIAKRYEKDDAISQE